MRINTNLTAMNTYGQYTANNNKIGSAVAKLSSGYAINTAADNATGLAISEKMRAQIRGLTKASANAQDAISLVQTAEGALGSSTEILQRMRELAVQSASDTNENEIDRTALQDEFSQLQKELDEIAKTTTFNKKTLLDGSLATSTKNLGSTSLANSGMTVELGNAATGSYNFSVTTKLEVAAVEARNPDKPELVLDGADSYFKDTSSVSLGGEVKASDLLNGNYTLSASYADPTNDLGDGQIKVTANGDNGQTFEATITKEQLDGLATDGTLNIRFNASADDAFNLSLELANFVAEGEDNYDTLAANISKLTVSVAGGVTARDAEYGVYANLTGAESVKLESGMDSVTFANGIKVNFGKLTASSVDTTNNAAATGAGTAITTAAINVNNMVSYGTSGSSTATLAVTDTNHALSMGDFTVGSNAGKLVLTDAAGNVFTSSTAATGTSAEGAPTELTFAAFVDSDGDTVAGLSAVVTTNNATADGIAVGLNSGVQENATNGNVGLVFADTATGTAALIDQFAFTDDSIVSEGALAISTSTSGSNTIFTATDGLGTEYTATLATADMTSEISGGTATNMLTFTATNGSAGFTARLKTTNEADNGVTFEADSTPQTTATIDGAGHNYTKVFGQGTDENLSAPTASSFIVEATQNAGLTFQVGANQGDSMVINIDKMDATYLGVASAGVATREGAQSAIKAVDSAINQVSSQRAYLGAIQNRLDYKISNLNTSTENLTSAESQIRDVDMAKEMTNFTNSNILQQAATAMLAQANALPQNVLSLIGG
ncbi:MAG: hypothetical protein GXY05_10315 [Clostridiales bacterium]|nr:hypothetical protein [Clostridiales bacterium]